MLMHDPVRIGREVPTYRWMEGGGRGGEAEAYHLLFYAAIIARVPNLPRSLGNYHMNPV